jgi:hypothetical protein
MNTDLMNSDPHERARLMIALSGPEDVSNRERSWLAAHLESCPSCREFAESTGESIRSLRGIPITASARLISMTQMRVRQRGLELQRQQNRGCADHEHPGTELFHDASGAIGRRLTPELSANRSNFDA